ncbi:YopX family protein [Paenibacillus campinasensis]|uniref:YopX protein domain-containing protein n=1 Tax=Paenibacillus campinasensis TaxID=66347 RepID=A0A268ELG1_9BACL|nr:YopX family protein [Paenibacillus campinasensis]PAD73958.1 hypothetical protein CHH67_19180 [Paenibacillus campinasensis]
MRGYRFRGKRLDNGEWVFGFGAFIWEDDGVKRAEIYSTCGVYDVDPETVGQYTGKKDEEKNEIFDGDKLYAPGNLDADLQYVGTVEWDDNDNRWEVASFHGRFEYIPDGCVVHGNRWDNPDLLGSEKV